MAQKWTLASVIPTMNPQRWSINESTMAYLQGKLLITYSSQGIRTAQGILTSHSYGRSWVCVRSCNLTEALFLNSFSQNEHFNWPSLCVFSCFLKWLTSIALPHTSHMRLLNRFRSYLWRFRCRRYTSRHFITSWHSGHRNVWFKVQCSACMCVFIHCFDLYCCLHRWHSYGSSSFFLCSINICSFNLTNFPSHSGHVDPMCFAVWCRSKCLRLIDVFSHDSHLCGRGLSGVGTSPFLFTQTMLCFFSICKAKRSLRLNICSQISHWMFDCFGFVFVLATLFCATISTVLTIACQWFCFFSTAEN